MKRMKIYQPDRSTLELQVQEMVQGIQRIRQEMDDIEKELDFVVASFAMITDPVNPAAEKFYSKYGFQKLEGSGRMFLMMKTIKRLF